MLKRFMEGGVGLFVLIINIFIRWKMYMFWQKVCILDLYMCIVMLEKRDNFIYNWLDFQ